MQHKLESLESRRLLARTGAISGSVYNDLNANARHEAGEVGMKRVRVYLDANNNGAWIAQRNQRSQRQARPVPIRRAQRGTHRLREVTPANHRISGPRSGWFKITLTKASTSRGGSSRIRRCEPAALPNSLAARTSTAS